MSTAITTETLLSALTLGARAKKALETTGTPLTATVGSLATFNVEAALKEKASKSGIRELREIAISVGIDLIGGDKVPAAAKREAAVEAKELPEEFVVTALRLAGDEVEVTITAEETAFLVPMPATKAPTLGAKYKLTLEAIKPAA